MKFLLLFTSLFLTGKAVCLSQHTLSERTKADKILERVSAALNGFNNIRYDYNRELNYYSEHYQAALSGDIYYDFKDTASVIGFRYQMEDQKSKQVFNGTEAFNLDRQKKTLVVNDHPKWNDFDRLSLFYNSVITLRNALPVIIADKSLPKTVKDTILRKTSFYLVKIVFNNTNCIDPFLGKNRQSYTIKKNIVYKIIIDRKSYLPLEVIQTNNLNKDFTRTSFSNIKVNTTAPAALTWYYSTYSKEYTLAGPADRTKLISKGTTAPSWNLSLYETGRKVTLNDFRGKVILLDFWIKNCGPCIESVPHLNALQKEYKDWPFEILGINAYDSKEDIRWFCKIHPPAYKILVNGKAVAEKYGVSGFPTVVLLDKDGKVLYSGGLEQSTMEALVKKAL